jgi:hypothetical protein
VHLLRSHDAERRLPAGEPSWSASCHCLTQRVLSATERRMYSSRTDRGLQVEAGCTCPACSMACTVPGQMHTRGTQCSTGRQANPWPGARRRPCSLSSEAKSQ